MHQQQALNPNIIPSGFFITCLSVSLCKLIYLEW